MRILVVDDDGDLLALIGEMLRDEKFTVDCSNNARHAVELVGKTDYDFVLVDYLMPDNDGMWFMKNAGLGRQTKAILVTAFVNREVIKKMFSLGVTGYIIKPFSRDELLRHLEFYAKPGARLFPQDGEPGDELP